MPRCGSRTAPAQRSLLSMRAQEFGTSVRSWETRAQRFDLNDAGPSASSHWLGTRQANPLSGVRPPPGRGRRVEPKMRRSQRVESLGERKGSWRSKEGVRGCLDSARRTRRTKACVKHTACQGCAYEWWFALHADLRCQVLQLGARTDGKTGHRVFAAAPQGHIPSIDSATTPRGCDSLSLRSCVVPVTKFSA